MIVMLKRNCVSFLVIGLCLAPITGYAEEIKISTLDFCPLHCTGSDGELDSSRPGVVVEIYQNIFAAAGYPPVFVVLPFNRGMVEVSEGRMDAISGPLQFSAETLQDKIRQWPKIGPLYARLIYPEQTIGTHQSSCFFTRSDSKWRYNGEISLHSQRLGIANAHDYGAEMNAYLENAIHSENSSLIEVLSGDDLFLRNLRKLAANRVDIVLMDHTSGSHTIKKAEDAGQIPTGSVKLSECIGHSQDLYLAFSDQSPELSNKLAHVFDVGIIRIRKSGQLKHLLDKYGLDDWVKNPAH